MAAEIVHDDNVTFFDLLGGKDVVQAMLTDIASPAVADGNKDETASLTEIDHYLQPASRRKAGIPPATGTTRTKLGPDLRRDDDFEFIPS